MVGYLVNLVIPRGGEVSRCYNLYKLEKIPVEISFGTVVMERIVDLLCLVILIAISFISGISKTVCLYRYVAHKYSGRSAQSWSSYSGLVPFC